MVGLGIVMLATSWAVVGPGVSGRSRSRGVASHANFSDRCRSGIHVNGLCLTEVGRKSCLSVFIGLGWFIGPR